MCSVGFGLRLELQSHFCSLAAVSIVSNGEKVTESPCPSHANLERFSVGKATRDADAVAEHVDRCATCQQTLSRMIDEERRSAFAPSAGTPLFNDEQELLIAQKALLTQNRPYSTAARPQRLGEYEILERIGQGGMGDVYVARHTTMDQLFAVKVLPSDRLSDEAMVARFQREMEAVGSLNHAHVVRGIDAGEIDGINCLVMELLDGVTLSRMAKTKGRLPVVDVCEMMRQACLGLHHAHEAGIVHRDVKPSNLMLCRDQSGHPIVKVLDLGLARFSEPHGPLSTLTETGQMMGTLEFMAPEQGLNCRELDHRADVYSLGATLFKLLTGRGPFAAADYDSPLKMMHALANEKPSSLAEHVDVPDELSELVDSMLARDCSQRPTGLNEVAERLTPFARNSELNAYLDDQKLVATPGDTEVPFGTVNELRRRGPLASIPRRSRSELRWTAIGLVGFVLAMSVCLIWKTKHGVVRIELIDPNIKVTIVGQDRLLIRDGKTRYEVRPGRHKLDVTAGDIKFRTSAFEIPRGDEVVLRAEILPGDKVRITADGVVIGEEKTVEHPTPLTAPSTPVRYGDFIDLVSVDNRRLSLPGRSIMFEGHPFSVVITNPISAKTRASKARSNRWRIRKSMEVPLLEQPGVRHETINYGDYMYLSIETGAGQRWLTGNRSPHTTNEFSSFGANPHSQHESSSWLSSYHWQIRQSPEAVGTGPVAYNSFFVLGCRYFNADLGFDGFGFLRSSSEEYGEAKSVLLTKSPAPDVAPRFQWQAFPIRTGKPDVDSSISP